MKPTFNSVKYGAMAFALLAAFGAAARADVEDKINKSFKAEPGGQLTLHVDRGSIELKSSDQATVEVEVIRKARGSDAKAKETLGNHVVTFTHDGNRIEIKAESKNSGASSWFGGWFGGQQLQVSYRVTVPRKFDADLTTAGGSINVVQLTGKVQARTAGGSLKFEKLEGQLSGHTSGGSIQVASAKGKVDLKTAGGSIRLSDIEGEVTAVTSGGSIDANNLTGKSVVKTSGGSIELGEIKGRMDARTSGGSIEATLLGQPAGDCTFKTSGGSVTLVLDGTVAVEVDAHTSAGRVSTELPVTSEVQKKNELRGKINGGGPLITARTSGGNVRLRKS